MTQNIHPQKALFDAKKIIAQIVTNVVNLEGINFTVPEVQTLLDGITVGGHKIQDELITLNQIKAWQFLFETITNGSFETNKEFILKLHSLVAAQEALSWGEFRNSQVTISGTEYLPLKANELDNLWNTLENKIVTKLLNINRLPHIERSKSIYHIAIELFAIMARTQFFFDGNKRTARMMMTGLLLSNNLPMINVSAKERLEFNNTMISYYETAEVEPLINFLLNCIPNYQIEEYELTWMQK